MVHTSLKPAWCKRLLTTNCKLRSRNSQSTNRRDSGFAVFALTVWLCTLMAIVGIAVEVARFSTTATEVQAAADSAALAAVLAIEQGQSGQAVSKGQTVAAANSADGHTVDTSAV